MYKNSDAIYIRTNYRGFIPALMQAGPIVNPLRVPVKTVASMLISGLKITQYDPKTGKSVELTTSNLMDDTKFTPKPTPVKPNYGKDATVGEITGVAKPKHMTSPINVEPKVTIITGARKFISISPAVPVDAIPQENVKKDAEPVSEADESPVIEVAPTEETAAPVIESVSKKSKRKKNKKGSVEGTAPAAATTEE